jgi:hypothetical protein
VTESKRFGAPGESSPRLKTSSPQSIPPADSKGRLVVGLLVEMAWRVAARTVFFVGLFWLAGGIYVFRSGLGNASGQLALLLLPIPLALAGLAAGFIHAMASAAQRRVEALRERLDQAAQRLTKRVLERIPGASDRGVPLDKLEEAINAVAGEADKPDEEEEAPRGRWRRAVSRLFRRWIVWAIRKALVDDFVATTRKAGHDRVSAAAVENYARQRLTEAAAGFLAGRLGTAKLAIWLATAALFLGALFLPALS